MSDLTRKQIIKRLSDKGYKSLLSEGRAVREKELGSKVLIRGLLEFSNICDKNCLYCGLRRENHAIKRFRLRKDEISKIIARIAFFGIDTVILQSGDDLFFETGILSAIIKETKVRYPGMAVTLSVGERPADDYAAFRDAGADRFLLKQETMNPRLYGHLHPGQSLRKRIAVMERLRKMGYQAGVGSIIGLPGQKTEDLADDIIFFRDFQPEMIGIGPFITECHTPLAS